MFWKAAAVLLCAVPLAGQVDLERAKQYFAEARSICERDGGTLWGMSLCGPIVFADPATQTIATSEPAPDAPRPQALGFANTALDWGGTRWTTIAWPMVPSDAHDRARLMMHELFHRIQPKLGLFVNEGQNEHLDTIDGRYWMQLEWRALAKALRAEGTERASALGDALAFRAARRKLAPEAAENERRLEVNEGLAQYTGTVLAASSRAEAIADAIRQLEAAPKNASLVRTFAYASGAAYGLLLDVGRPGWTRMLRGSDDVAALLAAASKVQPAVDADSAAKRYDGATLRAEEEKRETARKARVAELRRLYVDGPVLAIPNGSSFSFSTAGITPLPGQGTFYPTYRTSGEWGSFECNGVLVSSDRRTLFVPVPKSAELPRIQGDAWTLTVAPGWVVRPGARKGDLRLVKDSQ